MDLETVMKSTDEEILAHMHETPDIPHKHAQHPEKFMYVPTTILLDLFRKNYRTHTFKFTDELGMSIQKYGQLEPILLTRDGGEIIDTDGRGRFWSNFRKGADLMPVEILYDVPELLKLQMEIDLNATKTKIDNEDIAALGKDIFDGLVDEFSVLTPDGTAKIITPKAKSNALGLTAEVMCRNKKTIRQYLSVANMDPRVLEENQRRRNSQSFKRLHAIARTFEDYDDQWNFYSLMRDTEDKVKAKKREEVKLIHARNKHKQTQKLDKLEAEDTALSHTTFYGLLLSKYEEKKQESFLLAQNYQAQSIKKNPIYQQVQKTKHYVSGAKQLIRRFPELKKGLKDFEINDKSIDDFLEHIALGLLGYINKSNEKSQRAVDKYFDSNKEETFEESIIRKTAKENREEPIVVKAVGEKPEFILLDQIVIDEEQVRSHYNKNSIDLLTKKISQYGQVKPGLVIPVGSRSGKPMYRIVVGNSRYQACVLAKTGYFKAFVRDDLKPYETKIYQAIEDMYEQDTILERSAMLHRMYDLATKKAEADNNCLTLDDFLQENRHLGTPGKLKKTMALLDLPEVYQDMINAQLITADGALAVNSLPEQYQIEFLFPLMTNPQYKRQLKKDVKIKQNELQLEERGMKQSALFENENMISYNRFYEQLTNQLGSISQAYNGIQNIPVMSRRLKENIAFNLSLAKTYEEITSLQKELQ